MGIGRRTWQVVFAGLAIGVVTMVGLGVAQNQKPPQQPVPTNSAETKAQGPAAPTATSSELPPAPPKLSPAQQDISELRQARNLYSGTVFADETGSEQERAAIARAVAAEEAAAGRLPAGLPSPIQVADEVTMIVEQLRGLARNLDQIAANHEDEENFARADQCRRTATRLRREARILRAPSPSPSPKSLLPPESELAPSR